MDLYATKPAIVRRLDGVIGLLERRGVSPDALTLAAVPLGILGGACLLLSPAVPALLLAVPLVVGLRLALNLCDGALARRTGRTHPRGELLNELGDRLADIALLAPVAFLPGAQRETVLLGLAGAIFASFAGLAARAAGAGRIHVGVLSKPGRMALLAAFAFAAFAIGPTAWGPFGPILLVGTVLTAAARVAVGVRSLP